MNPRPVINSHQGTARGGGMDLCTDAVDGFGDWLMELASKEEGERFGTEKLGLVLFNPTTEAANAKYPFRWKG